MLDWCTSGVGLVVPNKVFTHLFAPLLQLCTATTPAANIQSKYSPLDWEDNFWWVALHAPKRQWWPGGGVLVPSKVGTSFYTPAHTLSPTSAPPAA